MKKFLKVSLIVAICLSIVASISASAISTKFAPYEGYEYNSYEESTAAPIGYTPTAIKTGNDFDFTINPQSVTDVAQDPHDSARASMYLLDGKAGVVYKTDENLDVKAVYDNFVNEKGKALSLKGAKYIACDYSDSYFYVYKSGKIYVINAFSEVVKTINAPDVKGLTSCKSSDDDGGITSYLVTISKSKDGGKLKFYTQMGEVYKIKTQLYDEYGDPTGTKEEPFVVYVGESLSAVHYSYEDKLFVLDGNKESKQVYALSLVYDVSTEDAYLNNNGALVNVELSYNHADIDADYSKINSIAYDSMNGFEYYINPKGGIFKDEVGMVTELNENNVPASVDKVPSMDFQALIHTTAPDNEKLYAFSNENGLEIVIFNKEGGYIGTKTNLGISFNSPTDMLYKDNFIYVLDSENSRIVKLDKDLTKVIDIFASFRIKEKNQYVSFNGAQGFTVDDEENFYIAATEQQKVYKATKEGDIVLTITKPKKQLADQKDTPFTTTKVMLDRKGQIYVICDTINLGAMVFDQTGKFQSFFGANTVQATADVLINYIRRRFMTREQLKGLKRSTPITLTNFDIDSDGFVYTVTKADQSKRNTEFTSMLRKLNYQGDNIFEFSEENSAGFGDYEWDRQPTVVNTSFCDVDIDDEGYINLIDWGRGKIFQYSEDGDLITVFGGHSDQSGTFKDPVAIESVGNSIYVLDKVNNSITIFDPTPYTVKMHAAYALLDSSDADKALAAWEEVLKYNTNSRFPYYGMGRAYEMKEDYENAMKYFKLANAKAEYSKAFKEFRKDYVAKNIWWMALVAIAVIAIIVIVVKILKKRLIAKHGEAYSPLETKWGMPFYVLLHPVDGFEQFRTRNIQSIPIAISIVILWFLVNVLKFFKTGFAFNANRAIDYDLVANLISTVALYVLFIIANWAVCTLLNGKGRMREIMCVTAYALTPIIITTLINIVLSNTLTLDEGAFISIVGTIGIIWAAAILLLGLYTIHQYSFGGTIGSVLLTVLGMAIMALLIVLFFTLLQQCYSFIYSIYTELKLR